MIQQLETFSFSPPINLAEEGKWLLAVTSFEATISVFLSVMKTTIFQLLHQAIGFLEEARKQLKNNENY